MLKQINLNQALVCLRYHLEIRVSSQQSAAAAYWLASGAWITPAPVLPTFPWQSSSCTWMTFTTWAQTLDVCAWWSWRFELTNIRGIEQSLPYLHSLSTVVLETKRRPSIIIRRLSHIFKLPENPFNHETPKKASFKDSYQRTVKYCLHLSVAILSHLPAGF